MKLKKAAACSLAAAAISILTLSTAWAGTWIKEGDRYTYDRGDGHTWYNEIRQIDKKFYGFDTEGYRLSGWAEISGKRYYFSPEDGDAQALGWTKVEDKWYFLDLHDGHLHLGGPEEIDGKLYYFRWDNGAMRENEIFCDCDSDDGRGEHGRNFYQANADGSLKCNMEERNPDDPDELVRYDEKGRIVVGADKQNSWLENLRCKNDEHIRNTEYYRKKYGRKGNDGK